jgi:hypothetical protein
MFLDGIGLGRLDDCRSRRGLKDPKVLNSKPRLTTIEDISEAKCNMKTTHVALDAV